MRADIDVNKEVKWSIRAAAAEQRNKKKQPETEQRFCDDSGFQVKWTKM